MNVAEAASITADEFKALASRARARFFGRRAGAAVPYSQWRAVPRRKAAPMAHTRQCIRRAMFKQAFKVMSAKFGAEPRRARRAMSRVMTNVQWRSESLKREAQAIKASFAT